MRSRLFSGRAARLPPRRADIEFVSACAVRNEARSPREGPENRPDFTKICKKTFQECTSSFFEILAPKKFKFQSNLAPFRAPNGEKRHREFHLILVEILSPEKDRKSQFWAMEGARPGGMRRPDLNHSGITGTQDLARFAPRTSRGRRI